MTEANQAVVEEPALINREAESGAWFFKLVLTNPGDFAGLLDQEAYAKLVAEG